LVSLEAVVVLVEGVPKPLSYSLPAEHSATGIGSIVEVQLGSRRAQGYVIDKIPLSTALEALKQDAAASSQLTLFEQQSAALKPILSTVDGFLDDQLALFSWMADYYGCSLIEVLENAVPKISEGRSDNFARLSAAGHTLLNNSEQTERLAKKAKTQHALLTLIRNAPLAVSDIRAQLPSADAAIAALKKKELIEVYSPTHFEKAARTREKNIQSHGGVFSSAKPDNLTASQEKALGEINKAIDQKEFSPILLYGVTGSGKTEVYLRAIEKILAADGSVLVVVPEIALTPQLVDQFEARLNTPLALLHSQVGESARWNAWSALLRGELRVAVGARSAIFAPLRNLQLIIVDEEHETSYKQSDGLRYHGRDIAVMRANLAKCPIVLGSATPSFESMQNAVSKRYKVLEMPDRASTRPLPQLEIIDMSKIWRKEMPSENISPQLQQAISETLAKKQQVVILYNRRGFATYLQCESCSETVLCPNCSVTLTYHRGKDRLLCHYCNTSMPLPTYCRFCRDPRTTRLESDATKKQTETIGLLAHRGGGTEKVVDELVQLFPEATIVRMDRDTVAQKDAYRRILGDMKSGRADILVGTQMVAKGHDIPGVTLVGIIDADVGLHMPDFRSSEKNFQLITQAAGRAGRGQEPGRVLLQTREPEHPTIVATATGRFKAFARFELDQRKTLSYPPFARLLRLIISCTDKNDAYKSALLTSEYLRSYLTAHAESFPKVSVLGPAPAPHERLKNRYRWHIFVRTESARVISLLAKELNQWKSTAKNKGEMKNMKDFRLAVDVDPVDML